MEPEDPGDLNDIVRQLNAMARRTGDAAEDGIDAGPDGVDDEAPPVALVAPSPGRPVATAGASPARERREWGLGAPDPEARERLVALLERARELGATDLFLVAGVSPTARVDGQLRAIVSAPLETAEAARLCAVLVPDVRRAELAANGAVDLSWDAPGAGRLRGNVHRENGRWAVAIRMLPPVAPSLADLNLPAEIGAFADLRHGLVLVTGPAGSGKSTTLAALLALVTSRRRAHVIAIEDPIEYRHATGQSLVEQIEVGRDTPSFYAALRAALRQSPDVLLVGEMRDPETIALAITAAETGHLVFSTLHTGDAAQSISRVLDASPPGQQNFVRSQLAAALAAVISQQLLPRAGGKGRVPAVEVLAATDAVRNLILKGQSEQLGAQVMLGRERGMRSLDQSLAELVRAGLVDRDEARARARRPREFDLLLG